MVGDGEGIGVGPPLEQVCGLAMEEGLARGAHSGRRGLLHQRVVEDEGSPGGPIGGAVTESEPMAPW
jgi:hypothetical protein